MADAWVIVPAQDEWVYVAAFQVKAKSPVLLRDVQDVKAQLVRHSVHSVVHKTFNVHQPSMLISSDVTPAPSVLAHFHLLAMVVCAFNIKF